MGGSGGCGTYTIRWLLPARFRVGWPTASPLCWCPGPCALPLACHLAVLYSKIEKIWAYTRPLMTCAPAHLLMGKEVLFALPIPVYSFLAVFLHMEVSALLTRGSFPGNLRF